MAHQKDANQLVSLARGLGLGVRRNEQHHWIISATDGRFTVLAGTPGSSGALKRARSNIQKLAAGKPITKDLIYSRANAG